MKVFARKHHQHYDIFIVSNPTIDCHSHWQQTSNNCDGDTLMHGIVNINIRLLL